MIEVENLDNKVIGYITNIGFADYNLANRLFKSYKIREKRIGVLLDSGVLTSGGITKYLSLTYDDIEECKETGVVFNDIIFIPCSKDDLDFEGVSKIWQFCNVSKNKGFLYLCYDTIRCKVIGYLFTQENIYTSKSIYICMIECFDKGRNNGTTIVSALKSFNKPIAGLSIITAVDFWSKQGAVFDSGRYFII